MAQPTLDSFLRDVANHKLTILRNDGLYRHFRMSNGSSFYQYDVITFPGHLIFTGDLGTFVYARIDDMFQFFRGRHLASHIDLRYLAEKCIAEDKPDGVRRFADEDEFIAIARDIVAELLDTDDDFDQEQIVDAMARIGDHARLRETHDERFRGFCDTCRGRALSDDPEAYYGRFELYTGRFVIAAFAIPWGIEQFDAATKPSEPHIIGTDSATDENDPTGRLRLA